MNGLMLHCGSYAIDEGALRDVETPKATETWMPVSHGTVIDLVRTSANAYGYRELGSSFGATPDGSEMFGLLELSGNDSGTEDFNLTVGIRNSHSKKMPAGLVFGNHVFVCDNMAFAGELMISRRHKKFIMDFLPGMIDDAFIKLGDASQFQKNRILTYKEADLGDYQMNNLVINAMDEGVICGSKIPAVLEQWRNPNHPEFQPRNMWSAFNAFTECMKGANPIVVPDRTMKLYELADKFAGVRAMSYKPLDIPVNSGPIMSYPFMEIPALGGIGAMN